VPPPGLLEEESWMLMIRFRGAWCVRLEALLSKSQAGGRDYSAWVGQYASQGFEAAAKGLEELLDELWGVGAGGGREGGRAGLYRRAMELEYAFFDAHVQV
jgi:thiaminase